jgi:hypothetical protein
VILNLGYVLFLYLPGMANRITKPIESLLSSPMGFSFVPPSDAFRTRIMLCWQKKLFILPLLMSTGGMAMDHQQLFHVQASFALVQPQTALAAQLFYQRLFYLNPALRPLFQGDNQEQETQLVRMLTVVVNGISQPERTIAGLQQLGARHSIVDPNVKTRKS